jgi:mannosyltransferase OCH1-like enzyme
VQRGEPGIVCLVAAILPVLDTITSEYKLWTDVSGRELIAQSYPAFLATYDSYPYPIQRADAMVRLTSTLRVPLMLRQRYHVLHAFGGIYQDLDIGCRRSLLPLLQFGGVILPQTKPMGVSNDMMVAPPGHPFFEDVLRQLRSTAHSYGLPYATVLWSTGPMFLSTVLGRYPRNRVNSVSILSEDLYSEADERFFAHHQGSSWHGQDVAVLKWVGR